METPGESVYALFSLRWAPLAEGPTVEDVGSFLGDMKAVAADVGGSVVSQIPDAEEGAVLFVVEGINEPGRLFGLIRERFGPDVSPVPLWHGEPEPPTSLGADEVLTVPGDAASVSDALMALPVPQYTCSACAADLARQRHMPCCPWA